MEYLRKAGSVELTKGPSGERTDKGKKRKRKRRQKLSKNISRHSSLDGVCKKVKMEVISYHNLAAKFDETRTFLGSGIRVQKLNLQVYGCR